jgi:predicted alpha/beta hydrolase family esterase
MARRILFVQGAGKGVHDQWDNKLVDSLRRELGKHYAIRYPRMPQEDDPSYAVWKPALDRELAALREDSILIGHSVGGTLLVKTLTEQSRALKFGAICMIAAPFVGGGGWQSEAIRFPPNLDAQLPGGVPIHLWHGLDDDVVPSSHVELYARAIPEARVHRLPGRDHQLNDDLQEVAAVILSLSARGRGQGADPGVDRRLGRHPR